jgi:hypothetical protein
LILALSTFDLIASFMGFDHQGFDVPLAPTGGRGPW